MKKNLIYTVAFDAKGINGARTMSKLLCSSLLKTMWSGDIMVFRNDQRPLFPVSRTGLTEIYCDLDEWDSQKPGDIQSCLLEALQWRFKAHQYIDASQYEMICYLDYDCLALRNLDHLFQTQADVLIQREKGRSIQQEVFSGYLSDSEITDLRKDGINAGNIAVRGSLFHQFMEDWEKVFKSDPAQHDRFRDQTVLNRLALDSSLNFQEFERGEIRFPFHIDVKYQEFRQAALLHMVGEGQKEKIDLAFALYMATFYNDGQGLFLDFLEM